MDSWVEVAQVASGLAALAAVLLSISTIRSARRVPLTDAYMGGWQEIIDVLVIACEGREDPPPEGESDALMRRYRAADYRLSVIEAAVGVRIHGRSIRSDLNNLLIDTLYDDPNVRDVSNRPLSRADLPKEDWADCSDEHWERVINSVPFASMLISQVWDIPGRPDDPSALMRWYYPTVLNGLCYPGLAASPDTPAQQQLAYFLNAYVNAFVLPWIRDASREVLMGRLGSRRRVALVRDNLGRLRQRKWRRQPEEAPGMSLFQPTKRR